MQDHIHKKQLEVMKQQFDIVTCTRANDCFGVLGKPLLSPLALGMAKNHQIVDAWKGPLEAIGSISLVVLQES